MENLKNLTHLGLRDNNVIELPKVICYLTSLEHLTYSIAIGTLPKEIANLTQLSSLFISDNSLTMMPKDLGSLTSLTSLSIYSKNEEQLLRLPDEIINLINLKKIDFNFNVNLELTEAQNIWLDKLKKDNDLQMNPNIWRKREAFPF